MIVNIVGVVVGCLLAGFLAMWGTSLLVAKMMSPEEYSDNRFYLLAIVLYALAFGLVAVMPG